MSQGSVYDNNPEDWFPGAKVRSRPGAGPNEVIYDKVRDADGNLVSSKPANRAFLRSKQAREAHQEKVAADAQARARRRAEGKDGGFLSIKNLFLLAIFLPLLSSFLTGTYTFNLSPYFYPQLRTWWRHIPLNPNFIRIRDFTPNQLAQFDGSDPSKPLYLAIGGKVYDVSSNRRIYGPGGSYHMMAGRDASRSFVTGCFKTHLTHDVRGLTADQLKALDSWESFFAKHDTYTYAGRVLLKPIDPSVPIPPDCHENGEAAPAPGEGADSHGHARPGPVKRQGH